MVIREHGGPEVLHCEDIPDPEPGPGEVRVRVRAVALNHLDLWVRRGGPAFKLEYPHRLGSDIAGEIDAVGPASPASVGARSSCSPGCRAGAARSASAATTTCAAYYKILGENTQGGYAEYIVVPAVEPRAVSRAARLRAGRGVDPDVPDRVADGRAQGARRARRHRARARRGLRRRRRGDPDREAVRRARDRDRRHRRQGSRARASSAPTSSIDYTTRRLRRGGRAADRQARRRRGDRARRRRGVRGEHPRGAHRRPHRHLRRDRRAFIRRSICATSSSARSRCSARRWAARPICSRCSSTSRRAGCEPIVHAVMPLARAADAHRMLEERAAFGKVVLAP